MSGLLHIGSLILQRDSASIAEWLPKVYRESRHDHGWPLARLISCSACGEVIRIPSHAPQGKEEPDALHRTLMFSPVATRCRRVECSPVAAGLGVPRLGRWLSKKTRFKRSVRVDERVIAVTRGCQYVCCHLHQKKPSTRVWLPHARVCSGAGYDAILIVSSPRDCG